MIMSLRMERNSGVSRASFALPSGRLFVPSLTTHFQEARDVDTSFNCSPIRPNLLDTTTSTGRISPIDQPEGIPVMSLPPPLTLTASTPAVSVIQRPMRSLTPNNASLQFFTNFAR